MDTLSRRINNTFGTLSAFKGKHGKQSSLSSSSPVITPEDSVTSPMAEWTGKMDPPLAFSTVVQAASNVRGHMRSASGASTASGSLGLVNTNGGHDDGAASRSHSVNSVSSEGSNDCSLVEQEVIVALTASVRAFKEALSKLRRIFHPEREKQEVLRVAAHERLGEILRILRLILEKYPPLQSTELLMAAGHLIQQVKNFNYENEKCSPTEFFEVIDQLALAFSSRVSEYLMGDIDTSSSLHPATRTRSCENLIPGETENFDATPKEAREPEPLAPEEIDEILMKVERGVDVALHRAKLWSKYAKDVITYIDKRASLEAEYSRSLLKLAQNMRQSLKDQSCLPFQSIYCTALDEDTVNANDCLTMCTALQENKFVEPLTARRNEHDRQRKQLKELWQRELKKTNEAIANLRKARSQYIQRNQEYDKAKESLMKAESNEGNDGSKIDKKKKIEDEANQKVLEAEALYKSCIEVANDRHQMLESTKAEVLKQVRELMLQCDQTMKAVTVCYFQMQHTFSAPAPVQFQTLCESSRLYEPGSQYLEFVKRFFGSFLRVEHTCPSYVFERYSAENRLLEKERKSTDSSDVAEDGSSPNRLDGREKQNNAHPAKPWSPAVAAVLGGSDSDSIGSSQSNKSRDTSPSASPQVPMRRIMSHASSGDELDADGDGSENGYGPVRRVCLSKAGATHAFRKLKTLAKCRECDTYVYFQGVECCQCGLACHKKCLEVLAIQCGYKKLPRKMTTFGVDLCAHLQATRVFIPHLVTKCVSEIDQRGIHIKGIYRVSGVKSRIEKLCQSFENGANLVDLSDIHPNVIANVLKLYLRQLPEPLLTFRLYPEFIHLVKDYQIKTNDADQKKLLQELKDIVWKLPQSHRLTLAALMHHLRRVADQCEENNMPPSNLGIVFGPTLLRTREGGASLASLVDTVHQAKVIELLIVHSVEIFGTDVNRSDRESSGHQNYTSNDESKVSLDDIDVAIPINSETESSSVKPGLEKSVDAVMQTKSVGGHGQSKLLSTLDSVTSGNTARQTFTNVFSREYSSSLEESNELLHEESLDSLTEFSEKQWATSSASKDICTSASGKDACAPVVSAQTSDTNEEQCSKPPNRNINSSHVPTSVAESAPSVPIIHLRLTRASSSQTSEQYRSGSGLSSSGSIKQVDRSKPTSTSGVGTQTEVSFLRNLSMSPVQRKYHSSAAIQASLPSLTKLKQSDDTANKPENPTLPAPNPTADKIVIHVAGEADENACPPAKSGWELVTMETPGIANSTAEITRVNPANVQHDGQTDLKPVPSGNPASSASSAQVFRKRLERQEVTTELPRKAKMCLSQNQPDQDSGFEDLRSCPDSAPGLYVSPYLSDDPYKKYRLGTGSSLSFSKITTFANYDTPVVQPQVPVISSLGSEDEATPSVPRAVIEPPPKSASDLKCVEKCTSFVGLQQNADALHNNPVTEGNQTKDDLNSVTTCNAKSEPYTEPHTALEGRRSLDEMTQNGAQYSTIVEKPKISEASMSINQSQSVHVDEDSSGREPHFV